MTFLSIIILATKKDDDDYFMTLFSILLVIVLVFSLIWLFYNSRFEHLWDKGIFPEKLKFTENNLLEAYVCLGARMVQMDNSDAGDKVKYMVQYLKSRFPTSDYSFSHSLWQYYQHPIKLTTVSRWLNINIPSKTKRIQVLYFLAGMSMTDGIMTAREKHMISRMSELLELSPADLRSVLGMYEKYDQEKRAQTRRERPNKKSMMEICADILGVSVSAAMPEIKKAYRKLVKLHHPDKFDNEGAEQKSIAEERFIQIQQAYEYLAKVKT